MKKKILTVLLSTVMLSTILIGCWNNESYANEVEETSEIGMDNTEEVNLNENTNEETEENNSENEVEIEIETVYLLSEVSRFNNDGSTYIACEYEYDELGNKTEEIAYESGRFAHWYQWEYDAVGNMILETSLNEDGLTTGTKTYEYDAMGNIIKVDNVEHSIAYGTDSSGEVVSGGIIRPAETQIDDYSMNVDNTESEEKDGVTTYQYDNNGNLIKKIDVSGETVYEYDANGYMIRQTFVNSGDGGGYVYKEDEVAVVTKEWEYDSTGNQIKETIHSEITINSGGERERTFEESSWTEWEYDERGNNIKETHFDVDGNIDSTKEWEYDENGNNTRETYTGRFEDSKYMYVRVYDSFGNMIKEENYMATTRVDGSINFPVLSRWIEWKYDENGNKISEIHYQSDGSLSDSYEWEYDEDGNLISEIYYWVDGFVYRINYEYITISVPK